MIVEPKSTQELERKVQTCVDFMKSLSRREFDFVRKAGLEWSPEDATSLLNDAYDMAGVCRRCHGRDGTEILGGICGTCGDDLRQEADAARFELYADPAELVSF
jgi:hypothetical protein